MTVPKYNLEDVFKISGVPDLTFVEPVNFNHLKVALRTPGRGVIVEGPSGVGKSVAVSRAISAVGMTSAVTMLSARVKRDEPMIADIIYGRLKGNFIIDDIHRLDKLYFTPLSNRLKVLADTGTREVKLVLIGINHVGKALIEISNDLTNRIDIFGFEANPREKIEELVSLGELALNIQFTEKESIIEDSNGSFYLAQMLCHEACLEAGVLETKDEEQVLGISISSLRQKVLERLKNAFHSTIINFCKGKRFSRTGRAPYLRLLSWLGESNEWSVDVAKSMRDHPDHKGSVGQVVDKGFLEQYVESSPDFMRVIDYNRITKMLSAEDPQFMYYLRSLNWNEVAREVGFTDIANRSRYDVALSFAGEQRETAKLIFSFLTESQLTCFYDFNESSAMLGEDLEDYLRPIYESEARLVVVILSNDYSKKLWTRFEKDCFEDRIFKGDVLIIKLDNVLLTAFDKIERRGYASISENAPSSSEIEKVCQIIIERFNYVTSQH